MKEVSHLKNKYEKSQPIALLLYQTSVFYYFIDTNI